jgi:N4-gp56 family major capsid protein
MSTTTFGRTSSQTVKLWSKKTFYEAQKGALFFDKFLGTEEDSILYWAKDLEKNAGDNIVYDLLVEMEGQGVTGDNTLEGNEEALTFYQHSILIDQLRHAHIFGKMSQQRTVHSLRKDGQWALSRWWSNKFEELMFRYLCSDTSVAHAGNSPTAPDSNHQVYSGDASSEATLDANDRFLLEDIDYAKEKALTANVPMRPVRIDGSDYFAMILHPYSVTDLKLSLGTGASSIKWHEIQQYANQRGLKNPIFEGSLGVYNGCILYESHRIVSPITNVRRNILLGAQAATFALGNAYDKMDQAKYGNDNLISWVEKSQDYENKKGLAAGCVFGMQKNVFNSEDFGVVTVSSYAAAHN